MLLVLIKEWHDITIKKNDSLYNKMRKKSKVKSALPNLNGIY